LGFTVQHDTRASVNFLLPGDQSPLPGDQPPLPAPPPPVTRPSPPPRRCHLRSPAPPLLPGAVAAPLPAVRASCTAAEAALLPRAGRVAVRHLRARRAARPSTRRDPGAARRSGGHDPGVPRAVGLDGGFLVPVPACPFPDAPPRLLPLSLRCSRTGPSSPRQWLTPLASPSTRQHLSRLPASSSRPALPMQPPCTLHRSPTASLCLFRHPPSAPGVPSRPSTCPHSSPTSGPYPPSSWPPSDASLAPHRGFHPNPVWMEASPSLPATAPVPTTLVATISTIQATVAASQERQRAASLALVHERATGAALTAQLTTVQHLFHGHSPAGLDAPPPTPEAPMPLGSMPTMSPLFTPRLPALTTSGPSSPSCWTRHPPTTLASGGRCYSPCVALCSPTTSSLTSSTRRPRSGP
jgi:hypothetical protein